MSQSTSLAKKRLLLNISSNFSAVIVVSIIGFWLTPYLIHHLGVAVYGLVPLVGSVTAYFGLIGQTISSAVGRFVVLNMNNGENEKCTVYFNSALFGLLGICAFMVIPLGILWAFLPKIFNIPTGYVKDFSLLFVMVVFSSFFNTISSPFMVSTFATHSFYVENLGRILSRLIQVVVIVVTFLTFGPSLKFVGFSYLGMAMFLLCFFYWATGRLTPDLKIKWRSFEWTSLREMGGMGAWMVIDRVGQLLYLNTDLIIINIFLGPKEVGHYAPILQLVLLMRIFTPAIGRVFAPVAIEFIAKDETEKLSVYTRQAIKFLGLLLALPIGILCGFSGPFLERWLGPSFVYLSPLVWLLLGPQIVFLAVNPLYNINRGMNKVKIPALVTLIGGVINIVLSMTLVNFTPLGLYGVALATVISYGVRNLFFHPIYVAANLKQPNLYFFKSIFPGTFVFLVVATACYWLTNLLQLASYPRLFASAAFISIPYAIFAFFLVLNRDERILLRSLLRVRKRIPA